MNAPSSKAPAELAKDTLKTLALDQKAPTDILYAQTYRRLAGLSPMMYLPQEPVHSMLQRSAAELILGQLKKNQWLTTLERCVEEGKHDALVDHIDALLKFGAQKVQALESSLTDKERQIEQLKAKHQALISQIPQPNAAGLSMSEQLLSCACSQTQQLLESAFYMYEAGAPTLEKHAHVLRSHLELLQKDPQNTQAPISVAQFKSAFTNFNHQLSFVVEDQQETQHALLRLLQLVFEHLGALSVDEPWIQTQIEVLTHATSSPLALRKLDQAYSKLVDLTQKQQALQESLRQGQQQLQKLLALFLERLAQMSATSSREQTIIEQCIPKIQNAKNIAQVSAVIQVILNSAKALSQESNTMHQQLDTLRQSVQEHQLRIAQLQEQLELASATARHDTLTGALNRKGMDEALERECSRALRQESTLCIALIDIDDFKKINDTLGHDSGDAALKHLAHTVRQALRPNDILARFGGEEFVIILPDTDLEGATLALTRLQRELTRKLFVYKNTKIVYTFSAGVTQMMPGESPAEALERSDANMYLAKRSGKNRVIAK